MTQRSRRRRTGLAGALRLAVAAPFYLVGLSAMSLSVAARGALVAGGLGLVLAGVAAGSVPGPMPVVGYAAIGVLVGGLAFLGFVSRARRELRDRLRVQPAIQLLSAHEPGTDAERRARGTLERLARQVDLPVPALRVVRADRAVCFSLAYPTDDTPVAVVEETMGLDLRRRPGREDSFTPTSAAMAAPIEADAVVVVSTGLIDRLSPDELSAVLAHEVAHLRNGDLALMNRLLLPVAWGESALGTLRRDVETIGGRRWIAGLRTAITRAGRLVALAAALPAVAVMNRGREFAADRGGVEITGSPAALASALERLDREAGAAPVRDLRSAAVVNVVAPPTGGLPFSHPATERRIERLRAMIDDSA